MKITNGLNMEALLKSNLRACTNHAFITRITVCTHDSTRSKLNLGTSRTRTLSSWYSCNIRPLVHDSQKHPVKSVHKPQTYDSGMSYTCNNNVSIGRLGCLKHSAWSGMPLTRQYSTSQVVEEIPKLSPATADLFFPDFPTVLGAEKVFEGIHNLGLPWWSTIMVSAFILRILLPLPLSISSMHNSARLQRLQPEIKEIALGLRKEVSMAMHQFGWDEKKAKGEYIKNLKRHLRNLYIRDNCHPMRDTASFWIRIPIWVSASYALRNMSVRANNPILDNHDGCHSMTTEGIAWFADLTVVDSTFILPVAMGLVTLLNVEVGRRNVAETTTYRKVLTVGLRSLALVFIPISAYLPSGLVLYWISSGLFSAFQTATVDRSTTFQRLIGIEPPSKTSETSPQPSDGESKSDKTKS